MPAGVMFVNTLLILQTVNKFRALHCVPPIHWDTKVQTSAQNWSSYLANTNSFEHSRGKYGENLAMMYNPSLNTDASQDVISGINMWYDEITKYDYNNPGFSMETGHFTQLVWKSTKAIGVGVAKSAFSRVLVVMHFSPPGNINAPQFFVDNVRPLCSTLSPPPPPPSLPSPPTKPTSLYVTFSNNDLDGYTTKKAIYMRMALQTLTVPYSARVQYVNNTGATATDSSPSSYSVTFFVGPFNTFDIASNYANNLIPSNFGRVTGVNVINIVYKLT